MITVPFKHISIHTPLAGSDLIALAVIAEYRRISIHTPLAGSDKAQQSLGVRFRNFNPHSPCGERPLGWRSFSDDHDFNPHSPCGERPVLRAVRCGRGGYFNPHSPCGERPTTSAKWTNCWNFNPHSPCGERRNIFDSIHYNCKISIHTPLAGSDWFQLAAMHPAFISIHTPLAGSDMLTPEQAMGGNAFQSTLPLRGATHQPGHVRTLRQISIHTPLAGSDSSPCWTNSSSIYFNPHSPCGERPMLQTLHRPSAYFNPHSPCGERPHVCALRIRHV